jgi:hypothetical protein
MYVVFVIGASLAARTPQAVGGGPGSPRPVPVPGPAPPTEGTGAISGVISDGETHRPIAGALVYLGIQGRGPVGRMSRQITDAKGRFVFVNLPPSDLFFMNAGKAGYNDGHYGDSGPVRGGVASGLIKLGPGQWFREANIPLWRPGVIAGSVVDERGEPVVGAYVRALSKITIAGSPHLAAGATTTTDDRGRYRLAGLLAGSYLVSVPSVQTAVPIDLPPDRIEGITAEAAARGSAGDEKPRNNGALPLDPKHLLIIGNYATPPVPSDGRWQAYPITFYPGVAQVAQAAPVDLRNGETRDGVDVVLRPSPAVRVSGRVEAPAGVARGLVLRLIAAGLEDLGQGSEVATAVAAADGSFTFLNVPPGDYTILASRTSFEYAFGPVASQELPGTPGLLPGLGTFLGGLQAGPPGSRTRGSHAAGDQNYWGRAGVSVGAVDLAGVAVPMRRAVSLRGRIQFDGTGPPPNPTLILVEPADGTSSLGMQQSTTRPSVDADDTFTIDGLMPGEYVMRAVGLTPRQAIASITVDGADYTTRPLDASIGQDIDGVVVTFTDRIASISGSVQTNPGSRLLTVIAFPSAREQWTRYGLSAPRFKMAPVSNTGSFKIDNIPAGAYFLIAVDGAQSRRWQDPSFLDAASKIAARLDVAWGDAKTVDVPVSTIK